MTFIQNEIEHFVTGHCNCVELSRLSCVKCTYSVNLTVFYTSVVHTIIQLLSLNQYLCACAILK